MKKLFYILLLLGSTYVFAQNKGMTYQAVIYAPGGQNVPGVNVANVPLANRTICLQFSLLDATSAIEYQEVVKIKTDEFGMVNITIGSGTQTGGYATSFAAVVWSASADKSMKVALDATGLCNQYEELSVEKLDAVPFANAAITAGNVSGVVALANGGTGATTAAGARTNLGIGNVDNTSDLNKPMSTATKTYIDGQLTSSTIVDADTNTKGKIQLAGDLAGTAAAPTVPGLALKENAANKSTTTTLGTSNVLFPTQNAVKTYVDTAIAGATIVDADANTKGKIQLAGDLSGTAAAPTVPGLALKLDASLAGVPNGVATLNSAGIIPANQLPPISVASTNVVSSQAQMLALSNATVGSIAVRTDVNKNFILSTAGPSVLANWIELLTPGAPVQSVNGLTGAIQLSKADINLANVDNTSDAAKPVSTATQNALNLKLNTNQVGVANGTASLNALGKIPTDQIPAISFSSVKVLGSQAEMLAQTNALIGSVVIRTDVNKNYVLAQSDPTILANWLELLTPAPPVQSVNGYVGNVSLTKADLVLGNVDNTGDINKPVSIATQNALDLKANLASPTFTGTVGGITKSMVGLANVDNTTDLNKPVSTSTQNALDLKANLASPTFSGTVSGITKAMVGLSNVDNTTDAAKPVSTATQTALDLKANTVDLTAETTRATTTEATLTTNVATNATAIAAETTRATAAEATLTTNVATNATAIAAETTRATTAEATLTTNVATNATAIAAETTRATAAEALKAPLASPTFTGTVSGIDKTMVGLGNVDNTTDASKPVSTATQTALDLKENAANKTTATDLGDTTPSDDLFPSQKAVKTYVDTAISSSSTTAVPYTGATGSVDLGAYDLTVNGLTVGKGAGNVATNTAIGKDALKSVVDASKNVALGSGSLLNLRSGDENTVLGYDAGVFFGLTTGPLLTSGVANLQNLRGGVLLGSGTRPKFNNSLNEIVIGYLTKGNGSNTVTIGNSSITANYFTGSLNSTGQLISTVADGTAPLVVTSTTPVANLNIAGNAANVTGTVAIANGGTGQTTKTAAFDALSPMTTAGDIMYGATNGTGTRLAKGNDGQVLKLVSGLPSWQSDIGFDKEVEKVNFGANTGFGNQANLTTAVGPYAGQQDQGLGATALGRNAGNTGQGAGSVAVGQAAGAGSQGAQAVAIGNAAGASGQGAKAIAIGELAGYANQHANSIILNATGAALNSDNASALYIAPIRTATNTNVLLYNPTTKEVTTSANIPGNADNVTGTVAIVNGGTGATTAAAALTNLGAEPTANKSTATNLGATSPSDDLFPTQKAVKTYVDAQTAAAGVSDGSITSAKILDGTIAAIDIADNTITGAKLNTNLYAAGKKFTFQDLLIGAGTTFGRIATDGTKHIAFEPTYNVESTRFWGNGNITIQTGGTFTDNGYKLEVAGTTKFGGNATISGTVTGTQFTSTIATGTAPFVVTSTTPVANLSIGGNAATVTTNANLTGDVTSSGNATTIGANKVVTGMIANANVTNAKLDKANIPLSGFGAAAADVALGANKLIGVADPTLAQDAATKNYVDTATAGITTLADGKIYLGNASNVATEVTPSGDVTITNAGVTAIGTGKVVVGMLATDAVETIKIKDANVTAAKLAADAVETAKIKDGNVTYAKIQNVATGNVLGRVSTGAGVVEEIATTGTGNVVRATSPTLVTPTLGVATATSVNGLTPTALATGFTIAGGSTTSKTLTVSGDATVSGTTSGTNTGDQTITLTGDVTGSGTGSFAATIGTGKVTTATIAADAVTSAKIADATIVVGDLAADAVETAKIKDANVTYAKIQNVSATDKVLGRVSTGAGVVEEIATTGSGNVVRATSPTLVTPVLGAATATTINKVTITQPTASATLTIADGKTLTANNSIVLAGTDATTMTFPTTDATIARTDAAQTFTGTQTFSSDMVVNSVNIGRGKGAIDTNTAVGTDAISATATGTQNSALGYNALKVITSGNFNTTIGSQVAMSLSTGSDNTALGYQALKNNVSGGANTAIGKEALMSLNDSSNQAKNTAVGTASFKNLVAGDHNVGLGHGSLLNATSGSNNVALGKYAGFDSSSTALTSSNNSIFIGADSKSLNTTSTNEIVIGNAAVGLGSNSTVIGNSSTTKASIYGALSLPDETDSTSSTTGALKVTGGVGIAKSLTIGSTTTSSSTTTGALKVAGGAGIAENLNVGGNAKITGTISIAGGTPGAGKVLTSDANGLGTWTTPTGVTTMAAIGSTPNANGATISGVNLNLEPASASYGGIVTTGTQTFAGAKTFSPAVTAASSLGIGTNFTPTLSATANGDVLVGLDINPNFTNGSYTALTNYGLRVQGIGIGLGGGGITTNTAVGSGTLLSNSTGANNTGFGYRTLFTNNTGSGNTALGTFAGAYISTGSVANSSGTNSTFIGYNTSPLANGDDNEVVIAGGNATNRTVGLGSNSTLIGNSATTLTQLMGVVNIPNSTASTSSTTGALKVAGGAGIAGAIYAGSIQNTPIGSTTASTGAFTTLAASGNTTVGGTLAVTGATTLSSTLDVTGNTVVSGTLKVAGGTPGLGKVLTSDAAGLASWTYGSSAVLKPTATATISISDKYVFYDGAADGTLTLPAATGNAGKEIIIKNRTTKVVTVSRTASETIYVDTANIAVTTFTIGSEASNNWVKLVSDGNNWVVFRGLF